LYKNEGVRADSPFRRGPLHTLSDVELITADYVPWFNQQHLGGDALILDHAEIRGSAMLSSVTVTGAVRALGASIGGQLGLEGAKLTNEGGNALILHRADLKGNAYLERVTATGEVRANGASIGGQLDLEGATLTNEGGHALAFDAARLNVKRLADVLR